MLSVYLGWGKDKCLWTTVDCGCMWTLCERWWVVGGVAWGEAFGCCHRHIRAQHQSSPFIRGCLGLSAPPSADESSIIDQTKYIQQPCHHYFSQLGSLQPSPQEQEGFFLKDAELNYIGVIHWTKNKLINYKSALISSNRPKKEYRVENTFGYTAETALTCISSALVQCIFCFHKLRDESGLCIVLTDRIFRDIRN